MSNHKFYFRYSRNNYTRNGTDNLKKIVTTDILWKEIWLAKRSSTVIFNWGKFLGGVLLTVMNNHYIVMSFINAATFGCAAVAMALIGNVITKKTKNDEDEKTVP